jgi:hypothetical protein
MWTRIANIVEAELPLGERPTRIEADEISWWKWLKSRKFTLTLPQLAGAGAVAVALIVFGVFLMRTTSTGLNFFDVQTSLLPEEFELRTDIERRMSAIETRKAVWDPKVRAEFEQNLAKIEESLKLCRQKLKENPHDAVHQTTLRSLYQEKRQLLVDVERLKW